MASLNICELSNDDINHFLIRTRDSYLDVVHDEEKLASMIKDKKHDEYSVVIDLCSHKPKYGEVLLTFQLIIMLKILGININCYIFNSNHKEHCFSQLVQNDKVMAKLFDEIAEFSEILLPGFGINCETIYDIKTQNNFLLDMRNNILFGDQLIERRRAKTVGELLKFKYNFFSFNQQLIHIVMVKYNNILRLSKESWLIGDIIRRISLNSDLKNENESYFATNFRFNTERPKKNSNLEYVSNIAKRVWERYNVKTLINTCEDGHSFYINSNYYDSKHVFFARPGHFLEESYVLVQSELLYQAQGGGISTGIYALAQ